jgi:hypothetical protein
MIKPPLSILELPLEERALIAFQEAVREVLEERAREGASVSIWRDGKVVEVPAKELLENSERHTNK